jgi:prevent-host-death family protein
MSEYSVADTKNNLPKLLKRALKGESVIITRHGQPVAEIKALAKAPQRLSAADWASFAKRRILQSPPGNAVAEVRAIRSRDHA